MPSRGQHWMDTRLWSKLRTGGSRMHYQQFDYSTSSSDNEVSDVMLPMLPPHIQPDPSEPGIPHLSDHSISPTHDLPQLFSDHTQPRSPSLQVTATDIEPSLTGTSAPLLTNPSLTDFLGNYPIWPAAAASRPASPDVNLDHYSA